MGNGNGTAKLPDVQSTTQSVPEIAPQNKKQYRAVVFNGAGTAVLVESTGTQPRLPLVEIPKFRRSAEEITSLLRERWDLSAVLLFSGIMEERSGMPKEHPGPALYAALEAIQRTWSAPAGKDWLPVHYALAHLSQEEERRALDLSYAKVMCSTGGNDKEPFSRLGWMRELQDWIRLTLAPLHAELGDFRQLNGSESFSLVRFETSRDPVWFKAVGRPNEHEFPVTMKLASLFPQFLPPVLAHHPTYRGWLTADAGERTLGEVEDVVYWQRAAGALADLQMQSMGKEHSLIEAGCRDLRVQRLLSLVDPFLGVMAELMEKQTKAPPQILSRIELHDLGMRIKEALRCLESVKFAETIGHCDFNPGNILVSDERCLFIDWAEACVGHPFLTFEYLIAHLRKDFPSLTSKEGDIRSSYEAKWLAVMSRERISEGLLFSRLVAVFAYAVAGNMWRDAEILAQPAFGGFFRSLVRRMKAEADAIQQGRTACIH